jgi:16S rRNA (cytosine967-C5)-methyltransferase
MKKNERQQSLDALVTVFKHNTPLSHLIAPLSPFSRELCFGVCRYYFRLEAIAQALLTKKPKGLDLWLNLLMGLYQLHELNLPDYAVVQETVALISRKHATWAKGLINAVLRTYCRDRATLIEQLKNKPAYCHNHPAWFIQRMQEAWPKDWQRILQANDIHPPMTLRAHALHGDAADYLTELNQVNINATACQYATHGITLNTPCDVHLLPGFRAGHISVQDEAAQLAPTLLQLKPGLRVLDACSAPGGKTCHLLESEPNLSACVALDIDARRLSRVQDNLNRLNLHATLIAGDALQPHTWWDGLAFDRILLDAPCSATGVIRRHPDIKCLRTEEEIKAIIQVQQNLLETLWPLLAPGGILVYATCSVIPDENELQIGRFIKTKTDAILCAETRAWGRPTGHGQQILPGENNMDGFFYGVIKKAP